MAAGQGKFLDNTWQSGKCQGIWLGRKSWEFWQKNWKKSGNSCKKHFSLRSSKIRAAAQSHLGTFFSNHFSITFLGKSHFLKYKYHFSHFYFNKLTDEITIVKFRLIPVSEFFWIILNIWGHLKRFQEIFKNFQKLWGVSKYFEKFKILYSILHHKEF